MNDMQEKIAALEEKGWSLRAIADEIETHWTTVARWKAGSQYPDHAHLVLMALDGLLARKRIPKRRRYAPGEHHTQRKSQEAGD